jgi:hypothetical protein
MAKGEYGKYQFLFLYLVFLGFIIYISSQAGATLIKNAPEPPKISLPVYPNFTTAEELNNKTGTNCFYETRVYFTPVLTEIGKRNTYKLCTPECIKVSPECYVPGQCSKSGQLSCLITSEATWTQFGSPFGAYLGFIWDSFTYFFKLMGISTEFLIFGILLLIPFIIVLILIILELISEYIPKLMPFPVGG